MASLRKSLRPMLFATGTFIGKSTDPEQLGEFMRTVSPVETEHPLIRIGGAGDGGYLLPDDLAGISACFSPGVGAISDFENTLAARGIKSYLADYSVDGPGRDNDRFDFEKKFLGSRTTGNFMTLRDWMGRKAPPEGDMLLQMDIEGAEYDVLFETPDELLARFRIIVIEFHRLENLLHQETFSFLRLIFEKLTKQFDVVHIHPNNACPSVAYREFEIPMLLEVTLLRKDRSSRREPARAFPHPLDGKNVPGKPDLTLPKCWHS